MSDFTQSMISPECESREIGPPTEKSIYVGSVSGIPVAAQLASFSGAWETQVKFATNTP